MSRPDLGHGFNALRAAFGRAVHERLTLAGRTLAMIRSGRRVA